MNSAEGNLATETVAAIRKIQGGAVYEEKDTRTSHLARCNLGWERVCIDNINALKDEFLEALSTIPNALFFRQKTVTGNDAISLSIGLSQGDQRVFVQIDNVLNRLHVSISDCTTRKRGYSEIEETA